ncbi:MAG: hypothetical protein JSS61_02455 [Verrucomicrobia bacterium]|nr:hypothetical protein [Verrucomicrobiota bacterium]
MSDMINPSVLEAAFGEFSKNLQKWVPDGIIHVDLKLLSDLGLLNHAELEHTLTDAQLNHHFHIIETPEKVTLFNDQFAVWIVPQVLDECPTTTTLIALLHGGRPHLEIAYQTAGVYNTPKYILKILQLFLAEVQDTEAVISAIGKKA